MASTLTGRYCPTLTSRNAASKGNQIRLGPAAVGVSDGDTPRVMMRKRHALLALVASVSVQLLSLMLWNNVPIAAAFAAPAVVATALSMGWYALRESEDPMRWATLANGFLYSGLHFIADGCQTTTRTGSGLFFMALPSLATHMASGGSAVSCGAAAVAHSLLFVIYAAVDGARDTPCFAAIADPPVTDSPVATLLMGILPGAIVVGSLLLAQSDIAMERVHWDTAAELASVLLFDLPEGESEAAHATALKVISERSDPTALSVIDEALLLFTSIAAIKQVPPAVVISEGPVVVEPPRKEPAPVPTPSPTAAPPSATTLHVSQALDRSTRKRSTSVSSEDIRSQSPAARGAGPRRRSERRGSMRIMPVQTVVLESCYILLVSMPRLSTYAQQTQQAEMMRLLLNEFYTCVEQNATLFEGSVVNACFSDVYVKFGNARLAAAAAHAIQQRLKQDAQHHRDIRFLEVQPTATACVLLPASTCCGDAMGNGSLGTCDVSGLFDGLKYRASTSPGLPLVLMPTVMCGAVESDFELRESSIPGISQIVEPRALTEFGFAQVAVAADGGARAYELPEVDDVLRPPMRPGSPEYARLNTAGAPATRGGSRRPKSAKQKEMEASPELLALWRKYDIDNSGALDRAEVGDLMDELGLNMTEDDLNSFFDEVDSDQSGTVSVQEFIKSFNNPNVGGLNAILEVRKAAHALRLKTGASSVHAFYTAWNKYDPTNSGVLQAAELHSVLKDIGVACSAQQCEWIVEKLDRDGNGKVDYEEMAALFGDDEASLRVNATKARMLLVSRVLGKSKQDANTNVNPPPPGAVFSTEDQLRREKLVRIRDAWDKYMSWPLFMYVSYNMGIEMYRVCRGHDTATGNIAFDMVFDILFLAWFVLKLLYLPREVKGQLYYKREDITHHYVHSLEFVVDLLTILPLDFFYFGLVNHAARGIYGYYRVNKILSLYHLDGLFDRVSKAMTPSIQRVTNALMWYIVLSHLFACLFIGTARIIGEDYFTGLIGTSTLLTREETTYLQAVLWALQILAGQIRGDPIPDHILLTGLFLLAVLAGIPTFAGVLGTIGNAIQAESSESRFLQTIDSLRGYFSYTKLPAEIEAECIAYYRHLFFTTGSLDIQANPLSDLPAELAVQITVGTGSEMLKKVPIFKPVCDNVEFVHELTTMLRPRVIEPGQRVMRKGERGDNMYFITYGDFHIVNDDGVTLFTLRKGNFFGEIALLHNVKRTATIVCDKDRYANVMILSKRDFDQVAQTFPDCLSEIYKSAETRLKAILEAEAEEQRKAKEARRAERDAAQSPQAAAKTPPKPQSAQTPPSSSAPNGATTAATGAAPIAPSPAPAPAPVVVAPPPAAK